MSRALGPLKNFSPYAPAFFLVLAAAAGGLRSSAAWLAFGAVFLPWTVLSRRGFSAAAPAAPALFFSWLAAAAVLSPEPAVSLGAFSRYAVYGLLFFYSASSEEGGESWLAAVSGLGAAAAAALVFQKISGHAVTGLIGANPNYSAAFCAAAFPPALLALSGAACKKERCYSAVLALLLAAGLYASGSRGAALAASVGAAAGLGVSRRWKWLAAFVSVGLAAAVFLPAPVWENLLKLSDPRAFERPRLWGTALEAAAASPLLGWGPGTFGRVFEVFKFPYFDGLSFYGHGTLHAHSELLNLAAEAGFPAALFFLLTAAAALLPRGRPGARSGALDAIRRDRESRERLPLKLCALTVFIQGGGDMIFYSGAVALLFWGSLKFSSGGFAAVPAGRKLKGALAALCFAGLALAPAAGFFSGREEFLARSYKEARSGRNRALVLALARSSVLDDPKNAFKAGAEARAFAASGDADGAEGAFRRALSLEPGFAGARLGLASVYAASGRGNEACAELARLENVPAAAPRNPYQRGLVSFDRGAAGKIWKSSCSEKKTGAATAPIRGTR